MRADRPTPKLPEELIAILMAIIRSQFCGNMEPAEWGKHSHFVKRNVVLWPARFMKKKDFTVSSARYEEIMREVFEGIKLKMTGDPIRYWPGYLMKCVQEHWNHHWEDYYREARSAQALAEGNLIALGKLPERSDPAVEVMAAAVAVLSSKRKQKRMQAAPQSSLPGF